MARKCVSAMDFLTLINGKVSEWLTADIMGLMQQIGAIPEDHILP